MFRKNSWAAIAPSSWIWICCTRPLPSHFFNSAASDAEFCFPSWVEVEEAMVELGLSDDDAVISGSDRDR